MGNVFFNLPVPAADGVGAAVNVSIGGSMKSIVVGVTPGPNGEGMRCAIIVEASNAAAAPLTDDGWQAMSKTFSTPGDQTTAAAVKWLRVRRQASSLPSGTIAVNVASTDDGTTATNLPTTTGDGSGASIDVSALGPYKTVQIGGTWRGTANVEISEDGTFFSPGFSFTSGLNGLQTLAFVAKFMRVTRSGTPTIAPGQPTCNLGSSAMPGGGGTAGGGTMIAVAGVAGQSLYNVVFPSARASAAYQVISTVNSPAGNLLKPITCDPTTYTVNGFTAEMAAGAEAGDILVFLVQDV